MLDTQITGRRLEAGDRLLVTAEAGAEKWVGSSEAQRVDPQPAAISIRTALRRLGQRENTGPGLARQG